MPGYLWMVVVALLGGMIGPFWDISWHQSIGRDTFWAWPHLPIFGFGALGGFAGVLAIYRATRSGDRRAVQIGPVRGPLGAFLLVWGGMLMLGGAPFDNWWHGAYGLDAVALSPPHAVLFIGALAINFGSLALAASAGASPAAAKPIEAVILYVSGAILMNVLTPFWVELMPNFMHTAQFYLLLSAVASAPLACVGQVSRHRWACTISSLVYTVFMLGLVWILPLFRAEPLLGPVFQPIDHFVPPPFPLLLVVPAFALDLLRRREWRSRGWALHAVRGALFLSLILVAQWTLGPFLLSDAARNWFFGEKLVGIWAHPTSLFGRRYLMPANPPVELARGLLASWVVASFGSVAGSAVGTWLKSVRR